MIAAVVPAAGRSERMGRPKLALPVQGRPMLERVVSALRDGGANPIVVVTGPHDRSLAPLARVAGAEVCELTIGTPDMRTTVERGLRWLEERYHPQPDDAFLLTPADIPFLDVGIVRSLCAAWHCRSSESILVPICNGRRGHPVLIAWQHVPAIRELAPELGIDAYLREHLRDTKEMSVPGNGSMFDVDTPLDWSQAAERHLAQGGIVTET